MPEDNRTSQRIVPYLLYSDAPAAIDFLCKAFGFEEEFRQPMPDGRVGHAELAYQGNLVMLASVWPEGGFASPLDLPSVHSQVYCRVDDVDAHYQRARAAGATIVSEPADQHGQRMYRVTDPEGHRWLFAGPLGERKKGKQR
jgi:PhnB protein